jgi:hypothetical protein
MLGPHAPRTKSCSVCQKPFTPVRPMQAVCSPRCAHRKVRADKASERARVKERKRALETIPELIKVAQREFNAFIRERDAEKPCISCGGPLGQGGVGGGYDCGHFRSTGSAAHLRFDERNAAGQCKHCNRYLAGNVVSYRAGLIQRIGLAAVEDVESDNRVHRWTREELREIAARYRAKLKELKE